MEHRPVLRAEVLDLLSGEEFRLLLDATVGAGGHALAFLSLGSDRRVVGTDRDDEMLERTKDRLRGFGERARLFHAPYDRLEEALDAAGCATVDAALFDLGVSSAQIDDPERGFSFQKDGPLDMRMDRSEPRTAADLVNRLPEAELARLIFEGGGERSARRVAAAIVAERRREPIRTTGRLASIVRRAVRGRGRIDPATRTFQALRMAVNEELPRLEKGLAAAARRLRPGGRLLCISFHSGEDAIVKRFFRATPGLVEITRKPVEASDAERAENPRSRSAKLRAAERRPEVA